PDIPLWISGRIRDRIAAWSVCANLADAGAGSISQPAFFAFLVAHQRGAIRYSVPRGRTSQSYQILDNFTWLSGKHTWKFGGEFRRASISAFNDNLERGIFQFYPGVGFSSDPIVDTLADFYTGGSQDTSYCCTYSSVDTGNTQRTTHNSGLSFFSQDDYRLAPKFTLNFGLRWEYFGPLNEANNLLSNYNPATQQLEMVGSNGLYDRDLHDFGPRLGFAWNVLPNTVVRAGYGIYYDYVPQNIFIANYTNSAGVATNPIGPKPIFPMDNFNSAAFNGTDTVDPVLTVQTSGPFYIFAVPRNFHSPYVQNFNLNIQQQLGSNTSFEIGYVGS